MISIKGGTKTFSESQQQSSLKSSNVNNISAVDKEKFFDGKEVGDVLNEISDPNWVDPAKARRGVGNSQLDKESFMKLLLTQLQNQDPTNPMESHEMAAQLAQFSSLESLNNINASIQGMNKTQNPQGDFGALGLIGKIVSGDSSKISRASLEDLHEVNFDLKADAKDVEIVIKDSLQQEVRKISLHNLKQGKNSIDWDGVIADGSKARQGEYNVEIQATSNAGTKIHAETRFEGAIDGVKYTAQGPVLMIGNKTVKMKDIKMIKDPSVMQRDQNVKKHDIKDKGVGEDASPQPTVAANEGLQGVAMSRDMMNKMKQTGVKTDGY